MKGYIKGKNIILIDKLPENFKEGDEVKISITSVKNSYPFLTFDLGVNEYLTREKIYEQDQDIL